MSEEFFGPLLTVYVYDDADWDGRAAVDRQASEYALTLSIFASDRRAISKPSTGCATPPG